MSAAADKVAQVGADTAPALATTPTKKGAKRKAAAPQPTRRSLRENRKMTAKAAAALEGEEEEDLEGLEEDAEVEEARALRSAKTATRPRKPKETPEEAADALDAHNRNRINSMTDDMLRTRIGRITNMAKLKSFIAALEECGRDDLADEAHQSLGRLQAGTAAEDPDADWKPRRRR